VLEISDLVLLDVECVKLYRGVGNNQTREIILGHPGSAVIVVNLVTALVEEGLDQLKLHAPDLLEADDGLLRNLL